MYMLLHADHSGHASLFDKLGGLGRFLDEVVLHAFIDTLKLVLLLFLTYLAMELIEHKARRVGDYQILYDATDQRIGRTLF